jgi:hypothetical protein
MVSNLIIYDIMILLFGFCDLFHVVLSCSCIFFVKQVLPQGPRSALAEGPVEWVVVSEVISFYNI